MKCLIPLLTVLAVCYCATITDLFFAEWTEFKLKYGKQYASKAEEDFRMRVFLNTKTKIAKHNAEYDIGKQTFRLGINKFSDMLHQEFSQKMNGFKGKNAFFKKEGSTFITPANAVIPDAIDWRKKGAVTPVKDQGQCGSCWAFSSTGALEGQHFLATGNLTSLSEQNLVDCSTTYGNEGCDGGCMDNSFNYIRDNKGIDTETSYPYFGIDSTCRFVPSGVGATDTGFVNLPQGDEEKLKEAVATIGPISVAIDAGEDSFQSYESGIYCDLECSSQALDHAVLVVGYGTDDLTKEDYWLVKNSWGTDWGEDGYIRMCRNEHNHCGIATAAIYPLV